MKRILTIAGAVLGVLILILILVPLFVSANTFRPKLESMASQALGRKVQIGMQCGQHDSYSVVGTCVNIQQ